MEREIKFRGLMPNGNIWVYGDLFNIDRIVETYESNEGILTVIGSSSYKYKYHAVISETIGQFIGLKDKNGTEIYEGDIDFDNNVVLWCDRRHGWALKVYDFDNKKEIFCNCYSCEGNFEIGESRELITGNIHEPKTT